MRKLMVVIVAVVAVVGVTTQPAAARSPWLRVTIEDTFPGAPGEGQFAASGRAVDEGAVCHAGTTTVTSVSRTDLSPEWAFLRIGKLATCDDASGTFDIDLQVLLNLDEGRTTGVWTTSDGTGDYEDLRGGGLIAGDPTGGPGGGFQDTYRGLVRT